jgi:hypothetical protein
MMSVMFMQVDSDPWAFFTSPGSNAKDLLLVVVIVIVVAVVFFAWAAIVRTPRKSHTHYHSDDHSDSGRRRKRSGMDRLLGRKRHRRKRSGPKERPVNPTLSQVGGLPPPREDKLPPSH